MAVTTHYSTVCNLNGFKGTVSHWDEARLTPLCVCVCVCVCTCVCGINTYCVRTNSPHEDQRPVLERHDLISEVLVKFKGEVWMEVRLRLGCTNEWKSTGASQVSYLSFLANRSSLELEVILATPSWGPSQVSYLSTDGWGTRSDERGYTSPSSVKVSQVNDQELKLRLHSRSIWTKWRGSDSNLSGPHSRLCNDLIQTC